MKNNKALKALDRMVRSFNVALNARAEMDYSAGKPAGKAALERLERHLKIIEDAQEEVRQALE